MKKILLSFMFLLVTHNVLSADVYSFRKYQHVKKFYSKITMEVIALSKKHNLPAASVLAIAGLESGYGSGYVSQITGNVLSLGAFRSDKELPSLYLPYSSEKKTVLFDPTDIKKHNKNDLTWKQRPKSYKRDYRPSPYAGTTASLELLKYDDKLKKKAYSACFNDFATRWIVDSSNIKTFRNARAWLDRLVTKNNKQILFSMNANIGFADKIGGIPNSFNYRKTWPKKVKLIMKKTGLVKLINDIEYKNMNFNEAWSNINE